jgi:hypothetical protein
MTARDELVERAAFALYVADIPFDDAAQRWQRDKESTREYYRAWAATLVRSIWS